MTILVTGASGFVASHLVPSLLASGYRVRAASRRKPALVGVEWVEAPELDTRADWRSALDGVGAVIHLAARAHIPSETSGGNLEALYHRINAGGTGALALQSLEAGVGKFIYLSSCHVLASASDVALSEHTIPAPTSAYGRSKLAGEKAVESVFGGVAGTFVIVRPPLVYGPGNLANFARLVKWVRSGIPLPLGGIRNRRSFLGVHNLVDFLSVCLGNPSTNGQILMPTDGHDVSTPDLIRELASSIGRRARLLPIPGDFLARCARLPGLGLLDKLAASLYIDQTHLRSLLDWRPPLSLREGLAFLSATPASSDK